MACLETWYIELHILYLDATKVWEHDIQFWHFYFAGGDW